MNTEQPVTIMHLVGLFRTAAIKETFVHSTNAYDKGMKDTGWKKDMTVAELTNFFGLILFFGIQRVSERRTVWEPNSKFFNRFIHDTMKRHRFEDILRNLHWHYTSQYSKQEVKEKNKVDCFWRMADLCELIASLF